MFKFRFLIGIVAALAVAGVAYGAASTLSVGLGAIQSGTLSNLRCDTDGVTIHYTTTGEFQVQKITVDGLSATCAGGEMDVIVKDAGGSILWKGASDIPDGVIHTPVFPGGSLVAGTAWASSDLTTAPLDPHAIDSIQVFVYDVYP